MTQNRTFNSSTTTQPNDDQYFSIKGLEGPIKSMFQTTWLVINQTQNNQILYDFYQSILVTHSNNTEYDILNFQEVDNFQNIEIADELSQFSRFRKFSSNVDVTGRWLNFKATPREFDRLDFERIKNDLTQPGKNIQDVAKLGKVLKNLEFVLFSQSDDVENINFNDVYVQKTKSKELAQILEEKLLELPSNMTHTFSFVGDTIEVGFDSLTYNDQLGNSIVLPEIFRSEKNVFISMAKNPFPNHLISDLEGFDQLANFENFNNFTNLVNDSTPSILSSVVSSKLQNRTVRDLSLANSIQINLQNNFDAKLPVLCSYFNFTSNSWKTDGCSTRQKLGENNVSCQCNHLTYFGLLLDIYGIKDILTLASTEYQNLDKATTIGCLLSIISCLITIFTYAFGSKRLLKSYPNKITLNLVVSLLFMNIFILSLSPMYQASFSTCVAALVILHFFLLASFCWMGLGGYHMYRSLIRIYFTDYVPNYMLKLCLIAYGLPACVVFVNLFVHLSGNPRYIEIQSIQSCWLEPSSFYVTLMIPFIMVWVGNCLLFFMVISRLFYGLRDRIERKCDECFQKCKGLFSDLTQKPKPKEHKSKKLRSRRNSNLSAKSNKISIKDKSTIDTFQRLKGLVGLNFLLGLSWGLALLGFSKENKNAIWAFTILNSTQGWWIFVFNCLFRSEVREFYYSLLCRPKCSWFRPIKIENELGSSDKSQSSQNCDSQKMKTASTLVASNQITFSRDSPIRKWRHPKNKKKLKSTGSDEFEVIESTSVEMKVEFSSQSSDNVFDRLDMPVKIFSVCESMHNLDMIL